MARLSNDQLIELCSLPYESLTPGQRKSARTFKRRQINDEATSMEAERVLEDQPQLPVTKAYYAVMSLAVGKDAVTGAPEPSPQPAPATVEGLPILAGGWPDDIETVPRVQEGKWGKAARILRQYPGCVFVIADGLPWKAATDMRRRIRGGWIKAFAPKGAYRCEIAPDHGHAGAYRALASYEGDRE